MTEKPLSGRCLCGAVRLTVASHDPRVGACHCRMCQRWTGGLYLGFTAQNVGVTGQVTVYPSSPFAERAFCPVCGSHLWMRDTKPDAPYEIMPGLFDAAHDWPLRSEIYADRAMACVSLAGDHPRITRAEYESRNEFTAGDLTDTRDA